MKGLIVDENSLNKILNGEQEWLIQDCDTDIREDVWLIKNETSTVYGACRLVDSILLDDETFKINQDKHCIEDASKMPYKENYAWVLKNISVLEPTLAEISEGYSVKFKSSHGIRIIKEYIDYKYTLDKIYEFIVTDKKGDIYKNKDDFATIPVSENIPVTIGSDCFEIFCRFGFYCYKIMEEKTRTKIEDFLRELGIGAYAIKYKDVYLVYNAGHCCNSSFEKITTFTYDDIKRKNDSHIKIFGTGIDIEQWNEIKDLIPIIDDDFLEKGIFKHGEF